MGLLRKKEGKQKIDHEKENSEMDQGPRDTGSSPEEDLLNAFLSKIGDVTRTSAVHNEGEDYRAISGAQAGGTFGNCGAADC